MCQMAPCNNCKTYIQTCKDVGHLVKKNTKRGLQYQLTTFGERITVNSRGDSSKIRGYNWGLNLNLALWKPDIIYNKSKMIVWDY